MTVVLLWLAVSVAMGSAQDQVELDGPKHIFRDPLVDNLVGTWKLAGKVMGRSADHTVQAEWVLNHQFLRIHETNDAATKPGDVSYEAIVMLGYDNASERYVAHWIDVYGDDFRRRWATAAAAEMTSALSSSTRTARFAPPFVGNRTWDNGSG